MELCGSCRNVDPCHETNEPHQNRESWLFWCMQWGILGTGYWGGDGSLSSVRGVHYQCRTRMGNCLRDNIRWGEEENDEWLF